MDKSKRMGMRLSAKVREALEREAVRQNRSLSNVAETLLIERLKELGHNV